jgi:ribonuclease HII
MPWIVGIDEAGYGPNLGPLVMTSVACRVPEPLAGADLWRALKSAVKRSDDADDRRLVVEDSKVVYSPSKGLRDLELSVLATVFPRPQNGVSRLQACLEDLCPDSLEELRAEPWYVGDSALPVEVEHDAIDQGAEQFRKASAKCGIHWGLVRSVVLCTNRFNSLLKSWGSKGAVLGHGLGRLLACNRGLEDRSHALHFVIDKHGGRNTYAAMLQHALADGMVIAREEGRLRSVYTALALDREMHFSFEPRADAEHFCVALASMVSKYVREMLMGEFNRFWGAAVPGVKPTAGYPGDSRRFFRDIRPTARKLDIPKEALWRRK